MVFIDDKQSLKSAKHDFETAYIQQVIEANGFKLRNAAEALDIHFTVLMNKTQTKGITINKPLEVSNGLQMDSKKQKLKDIPLHLRGLPNPRLGDHKSNRMRGFKGSTYGTANKGQHIQLTPELIPQCERRYSVNQA